MAVNPKAVALTQKIKVKLQKSKTDIAKIVTDGGGITAKRTKIHADLSNYINVKRHAKA